MFKFAAPFYTERQQNSMLKKRRRNFQFVRSKLPLAAWLGPGWGARPSRLPFSASRQKPFPKLNGSTHGSGATPKPARETRALPPFVHPKLPLAAAAGILADGQPGARPVFAAGHQAANLWSAVTRHRFPTRRQVASFQSADLSAHSTFPSAVRTRIIFRFHQPLRSGLISTVPLTQQNTFSGGTFFPRLENW
jgi:hypothetical protein